MKQRTHIHIPQEVADLMRERINAVVYRAGTQSWTQVAAEIGISVEMLKDIRMGHRQPTLGILLMLCKYTGCTPNYFLGYAKPEDEVLTAEVLNGRG